ncbi:hypothetical protein [Legionella sp. 16cNR16C]|uniref:hypothetical protein n=1 Tax=Legionella sp. 16cNR16C TaxID=2905656 RepID=UPI001E33E60A|nr:hypothetical protein [Legionella sp. 16cNR16C]MCE3043551.1 hypothetical protein [Legionella sp. 16cNR16C]
MEEKREIKENNGMPFWLQYADLYLNPEFFKRGLLVVTPHTEDKSVSREAQSFVINNREFCFHQEQNDKSLPSPNARAVKKTQALLAALTHTSGSQNLLPLPEKPAVLFNKQRRDEIFLPLLFKNQQETFGTYVYPWLGKSSSPFQQFNGFSQFVTAGCMFGASLRAVPDKGEEIELINHQIRLEPGATITAVRHDNPLDNAQDKTSNPFELILLNEFEKNCLIMKSLAKPNADITIHYHLPVYDYLLFGIKLSFHHQITDQAFDEFTKLILERKTFYQKQLSQVASRQGIKVIFQSPFDNLLQELNSENPSASLSSQLNLSSFFATQNPYEREKSFVKLCLNRLAENEINPLHKQVWQDALKAQETLPETLEDLFKLANAVFIAASARNQKPYETCSLLPLSEKQIQLHYETLHTQFEKHFQKDQNPYSPAVNITGMEPVITYSPNTKGLLFYFACCLQTLSGLISNQKLAHHAARNLGFFAQSASNSPKEKTTDELSGPVDLQSLLPEAKPVLKH